MPKKPAGYPKTPCHDAMYPSLPQAAISRRAFSLVELLTVIAIIAILVGLAVSSIPAIKGSGDIDQVASTVAGALEEARAYAMANDTYTWVGFFEEDGSVNPTNPPAAGQGRVLVAVVASATGAPIYDLSNPAPLDPTQLLQVSKLVRLNNSHLTAFPPGTGSGTSFDARPAASAQVASMTASSTPFYFPP